MQVYNNTLCISASDLIDGGFLSFSQYNHYIERGKINRMRRASFETPALIEVASLPEKILKRIKEKYGENLELATEHHTLKSIYARSAEALDFYRNYMPEGQTSLGVKLIEEYTVNASLLIAIRKYYNSRATYIRSRGGSIGGLWKNVSDIVNSLKGNDIPHTLPENHRRLKAKLDEFEVRGYAALVSGKIGNKNTEKVAPEAKMWLLSRWTDPVQKCATIAQLFCEYNALAEEKKWKVLHSEKTVYNFLYSTEIVPLWYGHRYGELKSKEKFSYQHKTLLPTMRDSLWYSDGTKLNYYYQYTDNTGKQQIGTLQVYEVMDAFSEVFLGYCISSSEDFKAQFSAYKMALQTAGYKPFQVTYDNQGGHKKLETGEFMKKLAHLAIRTQPYNGKSKTIESAFNRFQSEYLKQDWYFTGHNITAHTAESKANMEYILANKQNLPTREEIEKRYKMRREQWNNAVAANCKSRIDNYRASANPQTLKLSMMDMVDLFAVTHDKEITCAAWGISFRLQNIKYDYMVCDAHGAPDLDWLQKNIDKRFTVKYDTEDMSQVWLYEHAADGSLRLAAQAVTKVAIHRGKQEQEAWEAQFIKNVELANKAKRLERIQRMTAIQKEYGTSSEDYDMNTPAVAGIETSKTAKKAAKNGKKKLVPVPINPTGDYETIGKYEKNVSNADDEEEFDAITDIYKNM